MLAEMASYYDELKDHDTPPSSRTMGSTAATRSELSLDLDDLEEMRNSLHRRSRGPGSCNGSSGNSNLSLSSWTNEPEATTGNLMMLGESSFAGYWRTSSLDSVVEHHDNSDDDEYQSGADGSFRRNDMQRPCHRRRHNSLDNDTSFLPSMDESSNKSTAAAFVRSQSWDGCLLNGSLSGLNLGIEEDDDDGDEEKRTGKHVHFEVPARLEHIHEFEKPNHADYNNLYYMAHEIQKMMDDFHKESQMNRQVLR
jgi:hypothetical protein